MTALPTDGTLLQVPAFNITEMLVPLTATTTYNFKEKLGWNNGNRVWLGGVGVLAPAGTCEVLDKSNVDNTLGDLTSLGLNEPLSAVGYLYEASDQNLPLVGTTGPYNVQMYTYQNLSLTASPQSSLKFCAAGYQPKALLAYPPPTAVNPAADGFLLEPMGYDASLMLLRELSLQPGTPFLAAPGMAFGRFIGPQNDLVIHPSGYAVALCATTCKLQILKLGAAVADADAPGPLIRSGQGTRLGLLSAPVALTCTLSTLLVMQTTPDSPQGSLSAFDMKGNPVRCFAGSVATVALRPEATSVVPVDISVERQGFIMC